jgi:rsbT antagonist protein RsbS
VHEVPGPVAILREGHHLVVSITAALDDTQMVRFRRELSEAIGDHRARGVLIDVAALDVLDSFGSLTIRELVETVRLRGASAVIVGVPPQVAWSMVRLGIDTGAMVTALDLEDGLQLVDDTVRSEERKS